MRRHLIKKIIREELAAAAKQRGKQRKILSEGLRTPEPTRPEPPHNRAIPANKKRSEYTSIVDEPDSKPYFVEAVDPREEEGTDEFGEPLQNHGRPVRRPEEVVAMLDEEVVDIENIDDIDDVPAVPGHPRQDDHEPSLKEGLLSEAQIRRWKKLARINEQELPPLDLEEVPEAGDVDGLQDQADAAAEDLGDLEAAEVTEDPLANIDVADEPLPAPAAPDEMEAPLPEPPEPEMDEFPGDMGEPPELAPLDAAEPPPEVWHNEDAEGSFFKTGGGVPHRDDDSAAISLRIREEITRILKEKL